MSIAKAQDLVLLLGKDGKRFIVRLSPGESLHTHRGFIKHDDMLGQPFGAQLTSHLGYPFYLLRPSIHDLIMNVKRESQIIYPKESGYVLLKMNILPGSRVIEAGTGSGAMTIALARGVMPSGRVYSYDRRQDMIDLATRNLSRVGVLDLVDLKCQGIAEGFEEKEVDALFMDVREPQLYVGRVKEALAPGSYFGALVPTTNQVSALLEELELRGFVDLEVSEMLLRHYKTVAARLRPEDRMVAHTGYLVFARPLTEQ
ncbi:MAG: tRNA (adenine-N1)-methyltransferase [Anaerolineae bacterium]|jgi:tRNA (adenine57-N1/adenine58-N1)-methyltransferase|nr:tRNA (adenine-N1)-methyltransferase [Anaerolineae bacterium]